MSETNATCAIYTRYSSRSQRDVSIDQQIEVCRGMAERLGLAICEIYIDRAKTGTNDRRVDFQRMIKDSNAHEFSYVIVYAFDRFARDRYDSAIYKHQLKQNGVKVLSATEPISDDPSGVLMESILEGFAEYYSAELSRKIKRGMNDNAKKGLANGSVPFGYRRSSEGKYVVQSNEAAIVREIFERVRDGEPFSDIKNDFNARGITNRFGRKWTDGSFYHLISNERYAGVYIYGDVRIEGAIPQIIDRGLFDEVQRRMTVKKNPRGNVYKHRRENGMYLLTGKLFCGECGSPMVGVSGTSKTGDLHHYYVCQEKRKNRTCKKKNVRREFIEREITAALKNYALDYDVIGWIADRAIERQEAGEGSVELSFLEKQLDSVRTEKDNVMKAIKMGIITESTRDSLLELEATEKELLSRIDAARIRAEDKLTREDIIAWLSIFKDGDVDDKEYQELLIKCFLVAAYLYDDGKVRIGFKFSDKPEYIDIPSELGDIDKSDKASESSYNSKFTPPNLKIRTHVTVEFIGTMFVLTCLLSDK